MTRFISKISSRRRLVTRSKFVVGILDKIDPTKTNLFISNNLL